MEKESKKDSEKRAQKTRFAAEAGASGGGGGFTSELCKFLHYRLARPATSERGAADLSRLRRVPAAEIETKSCGCVGVWVYAYTKINNLWSSGHF